MTPRILIAEDQEGPLEALEYALQEVMPEVQRDTAKWYSQAEGLINRENYDIVFLDNRMPYEDPGCTDRSDFDRFVKTLRNTGYELIHLIKQRNPDTIVIGTSSLSEEKLRGMPTPDFKMSKMWGEAEEDLESILTKMKGGNK